MNCSQVYLWMLSAEAAEGPLPPALRRHLRLCRRCARRRRRALRLNWQVRQGAPLLDDPAARARIAEAVARTPAASAKPRRLPLRAPRLLPWAAAAVLLLAILGALLALPKRENPAKPPGVAASPPPPSVEQPAPPKEDAVAVAPPAPPEAGEGDLLQRVVRRDLSLARADGPADQFQTLAAMAGDLWGEAERQARLRGRSDLAQLAGLYERVVSRGVVGRALALNDAKRKEVLPPVVEQLRDAAGAADRLAAATPEAAPALDRLSSASRGAAHAIETDAPLPAAAPLEAPPEAAPPSRLLANLVAQGLNMAEENNPLKRADCGAAAVGCLTQTIVDSSATADGEEMEQLGAYVAAFRSEAVADNLDRVAVKELDGAGKEAFDRVAQQSADAVSLLEQTMRQAPPAARAGLARALEAVRGDDGDKRPKDKASPGLAKPGKDKPPPKKKKHAPPD